MKHITVGESSAAFLRSCTSLVDDLRVGVQVQEVADIGGNLVLHEVVERHVLHPTGVHPLPDGALGQVAVVVDVRRW